MATSDDEDGRSSPLPLPEGREQIEFIDVLRLLEKGEITRDQAQKRLMTFYQLGMGAWIRALGETEPEMVPELVRKLSKDLNLIAGHYEMSSEETTTRAAPVARSEPSTNYRVTSKNDETLLRERVILSALVSTNQGLQTSDLQKKIRETEPDIKTPTVTANLDRLWKMQLIDRPRKGHYASSHSSRDYLTKLQLEIDARGLNESRGGP